MKLKVGDKVRVKKYLIGDCKYKREGNSPLLFAKDMEEYCGRDAKITECHDDCGNYYIDIAGNRWNWSIDMLELMKGNKVVKIVKRREHNWVIVKTSCNNHEAHLKGKTAEEATAKLESLGCGYELYKLGNWFARTKTTLETRQRVKSKRKPGRPKKAKK